MDGTDRGGRAGDRQPGRDRIGPRARDVPGPRQADSLATPALRWVFQWPYRAVLAGLYRTGLRAWHLTLISLAASAAAGALLLAGGFLAAGLSLAVAGILDVFDGALARLRGEASRAGALLDSAVDRVSDTIVFGSLFVSLALSGAGVHAGLALASLVVSLLVSQLRAEAEASGVPMTEGLFQRAERILVLVIGLVVPHALLAALALLTSMGAATAAQRLVAAWRKLPPLS